MKKNTNKNNYINNNMNIVVFAGGTLGHIKPALAISEELKKHKYNVYFFSDNSKFKDILKGNNCLENIIFFDSPGLNRKKILNNIINLFALIKTYFGIKKKLKDIKPKLCIGMGGSISTIGILASSGYKKIIHEQNAVIGLGNRIVMYKCDRCYSNFDLKGFITIGNPLNECLSNNFRETQEILILSGSNGSKTINDFFLNNINKLIKLFNMKINIITGNKYYNENIDKIKNINNIYDNKIVDIIPFTNDIDKYYQKSFLVIARAGAGTLSEIFNYNLLSIIIPSPNVTNNHQYYNSLYYYERCCIEMIEEKYLNLDKLKESYEKILLNQNKMKQNIKNNHNIYSKYLIVSEVEDIIKSNM